MQTGGPEQWIQPGFPLGAPWYRDRAIFNHLVFNVLIHRRGPAPERWNGLPYKYAGFGEPYPDPVRNVASSVLLLVVSPVQIAQMRYSGGVSG